MACTKQTGQGGCPTCDEAGEPANPKVDLVKMTKMLAKRKSAAKKK